MTNIELVNKATATYDKIMKSFSTAPEGHKVGECNISLLTVNYPNNYGDCYYADGKLHICLTDITEQSKEYYKPFADDYVVFEKVDFSHDYLTSLMNCVNELGPCNESGVFEVYLMSMKNIIEISVISNESKEKLHSHLTSHGFSEKAFDIVINTNGIKPCASVYARPGDRVYQWSKSGSIKSSIATITCNATKGTTKGFVTVLHALWHVSNPNLPLGTYEYSCGTDVYDYTWGKNTDSLFVPLTSSYSGVTGLIDNTNLYGSTKYQISAIASSSNDYTDLVGKPVKLFGKTTGIFTGVVSSLTGTINYSGLDGYTSEYQGTINNCVRVKLDTPNKDLGGNSGGPVCYDTGKTVNSIPQLQLCAMFAASNDDGSYVSCPRISNIMSELGLSSISTGTN